jgi:hypothetical protein
MTTGDDSVFQAFASDTYLRTAESERLNHLLDRSGGGLIGIAGGPGTGKSWMLLQAVTHARDWDSRSIALALSVRNDVEPFDFLLDLLAAVASFVAGSRPRSPRGHWNRALVPGPGSPRLASLAFVWPVVLATGIALIWTSISDIKVETTMALGVTCSVLGVVVGAAVHGVALLDFVRYRIARRRRGITKLRRQAIDLLHQVAIEKSYELTSYTTGSSVAFKAFGVEAGLTGGATYMQRKRTLAELASTYMSFLSAVSEEAPVYVAIDDLDAADQVSQLHGILGALAQVASVPRCHYVIALPDTGIPDYTPDDKAGGRFLAIIRLKPLALGDAQQLLAGRGGVASLPLAALCHCLAGGVPRDLLRISALIGTPQSGSTDSDLPLTALRLVRLEASRATEGVIFKLRGLGTPEARRWLSWSLALNLGSASANDLIAHCHRMDAVAQDTADATIAADYTAQAVVARLGAEYYRFATLLQVFGPGSDPAMSHLDPDDARLIETLTSARGLASVDPAITWTRISEARRVAGLDVTAVPRVLSAR